ncbi:MAG TPA: class I SAM-dependent methyltransferase [bacterium]|nr:class I SAM-dependent methyltransferase [bacterium]
MDKEYAKYLLNKTIEDYNLIAEDFARSRVFIPEDISNLGEYSTKGEKVLDAGCGNGWLSEVLRNKETDYIGIDSSEKLINIAKRNYPQAKFQKDNVLKLSFPSDFFNKVYSVSVLHHIPSKELQIKALKEMKRVLKPKGILILRVWNLWWNDPKSWKLIFKYTFLKLIGKSKLDFKDIFYSWKNSRSKIVTDRYIHCFTKGELKSLVKKSGFSVRKIWIHGKNKKGISNIYLIAENKL